MRLGVDIGGTFTDFVLVSSAGEVLTTKILSSPSDPLSVVRQGIVDLCKKVGLAPAALTRVVHGSTLVPNTLIERKGADVAMVTTKGFKDVIEIGREWRFDIYDIFLDAAPVLVERPRRYEVDERTTFDGRMLSEVDPEEVLQILGSLPQEVTALAICLLNSYVSNTAEQAIASIARQARPDLQISLSSDVSGEAREFERFSTAVANAYVQPIVKPYLQKLSANLAELGIENPPSIILSSGGVTTVEDAAEYPIRLVESGPAAGVAAATYISRMQGASQVLAFDMGGTTAKGCFIENGRAVSTRNFEVARSYRFKPGSGIPLNVTSIDLIEIGAGGGSIARVDDLGRLRVGPDSAGAVPGPVCYGGGGTEPTVTDADLTLGYLDPKGFLGGSMKLHSASAAEALETSIGEPLNLSILESAWGVHQLINEGMANAIRVHAAEHGKDISKCLMVPFGGAAGVHCCHVAERLGIASIVSPPRGSVLSAFGMLTAPYAFDFVRTYRVRLDLLDWDKLHDLLESMRNQGIEAMGRAGIAGDSIAFELSCDARYTGQGHNLTIGLDYERIRQKDAGAIEQTFVRHYGELHGRSPEGLACEIVNWRIRAVAAEPDLKLVYSLGGGQPSATRPSRQAYFGSSHGMVETSVFRRDAIAAGDTIVGPAIIEEADTSVLVPPGWVAAVDGYVNLSIRRNADA